MIERDVFVTAWIYDCAFFGTLAPFFRASESPIAIACSRLLTTPPLPPWPERSVPFFSRRTALSTDLPAAFPYFGLDFFFELFLLAIDFLESKFQREVGNNTSQNAWRQTSLKPDSPACDPN